MLNASQGLASPAPVPPIWPVTTTIAPRPPIFVAPRHRDVPEDVERPPAARQRRHATERCFKPDPPRPSLLYSGLAFRRTHRVEVPCPPPTTTEAPRPCPTPSGPVRRYGAWESIVRGILDYFWPKNPGCIPPPSP